MKRTWNWIKSKFKALYIQLFYFPPIEDTRDIDKSEHSHLYYPKQEKLTASISLASGSIRNHSSRCLFRK